MKRTSPTQTLTAARRFVAALLSAVLALTGVLTAVSPAFAAGSVEQSLIDSGKVIQSGDVKTFAKNMEITAIQIDNAMLSDTSKAHTTVKFLKQTEYPGFTTYDGCKGRAAAGNDKIKNLEVDDYTSYNAEQYVVYDPTAEGAVPLTTGDNYFEGDIYQVTFSNAAVLPGGTRADVVMTASNIRIALQYDFSGDFTGKVYLTKGNMLRAGNTQNAKDGDNTSTSGANWWRTGVQMDLFFQVVYKSEKVDGKFMYPIKDIDVNRQILVDDDYRTVWGKLYNGADVYHYSEQVLVHSSHTAPIFIPAGDYLANVVSKTGTPSGILFSPTDSDSKDSFISGFATAVNNTQGIKLTVWTAGHGNAAVRTFILGGGAFHKIVASTTAGGSIRTTTGGNLNGKLNDGGTLLEPDKTSGDFTTEIPDGSDIVYTMKPEAGYFIDSIQIGDELNGTKNSMAVPQTDLEKLKVGEFSEFNVIMGTGITENGQAVGERTGSLTYDAEQGAYIFKFPENVYHHKIHVAWKTAAPVTAALSGTKTLSGGSITANFFQVKIEAGAANDASGYTGFTAGEKNVAADGSWSSGEITFTKAGSYRFNMEEVNGGTANYTYDSAKYYAVVTVTVNNNSKALEADVKYYKAADDSEVSTVTFQNAYAQPAITATDAETYGLRDNAQNVADANKLFQPQGDTIKSLTLLDGSGNPVASLTVKDSADGGKNAGTYTMDASGKIIFTPEPGYVGDPVPVRIKATSVSGLEATATYTPHVRWQEDSKTLTRTIEYKYKKDDSKAAETETQTVSFTQVAASIDEATGAITMGDWTPADPDPVDPAKGLWPLVESPELEKYIVDYESVAKRSVAVDDDDAEEIIYYYSASPENIKTENYVNILQDPKRTLESLFSMDTGLTVGKYVLLRPTDDPAKPWEEVELSASDVTTMSVTDSSNDTKAAGEYRIDPVSGEITFMPAKGYTGTPKSLMVRAKLEIRDELGSVLNTLDVDAEYTTKVKPRSGGGDSPPTPTPTPPVLNTEDHWGYIIGYPVDEIDRVTGTLTAQREDLRLVMPLANITRCEVTTVFFRLLTDETRTANWTKVHPFSDVSTDKWCNNAIAVLSRMGIVFGYEYGTFRPDQPITRGEMAAFAARFAHKMNMTGTVERTFSDIEGHWSQSSVEYAASVGWIMGYPDGTYGPDNYITRAEFMTMVNRMLGRIPETESDLHKDMIQWLDNQDQNAWYYVAVQEATNSHHYTRKGKRVPDLTFEYEIWSEMLPMRDWAKFERSWSDANSAANPGGDVM